MYSLMFIADRLLYTDIAGVFDGHSDYIIHTFSWKTPTENNTAFYIAGLEVEMAYATQM